MWGTDRRGQCPLGHSTHHCNNFVQWSPPKPPSKACLRFGLSIEVRLFSLFKCFVLLMYRKKNMVFIYNSAFVSFELMWADKLLSVSCFNISFRLGVDVLNVSWMSELWIPLLYNTEAIEVVYEVRILGTFRKIAFIINSFSIKGKVADSYSFLQNIYFGILTENSPSWKPVVHYLVIKSAL